jgi:hypothetical protein
VGSNPTLSAIIAARLKYLELMIDWREEPKVQARLYPFSPRSVTGFKQDIDEAVFLADFLVSTSISFFKRRSP